MKILSIISFFTGLHIANGQGPGDEAPYQNLLAYIRSRSEIFSSKSNEQLIGIAEQLVIDINAPEFYIVVREETKDIDTVAMRVLEKNGSTLHLINYEDPQYSDVWMTSLSKILKPEDVRVVFLLLNAQQTVEIFKKIEENFLESEFVNWIVLCNEPVSPQLTKTLREGNKVLTVEKENTQGFAMYKNYIDKNSSMRFIDAGYSICNPKCQVKLLQRPLVEPLTNSYRDFGGRTVVVAAIDNWPFIVVNLDENGIGSSSSGIDYQILETVAERLNFSYIIKSPSDKQWGRVQDDGSVSGLIGMVHRREALMAIDEITMLGIEWGFLSLIMAATRETVVDFTSPYYLEATTLLSSAPKRKPQAWQAFTPFTYEVWGLISIVVLSSGPLIFLFHKLTPSIDSSSESLRDYAMETFRTMVKQDFQLPMNSWPARSFLLTWVLFGFIISVFYATTLHSVLVVPSKAKPIDSLADLLAACQRRKTGVVLAKGSSYEEQFREATYGVHAEIFPYIRPDGYVLERPDGFAKVMEGDNVYINAHLHSEIHATRLGREKFYVARQTFDPQLYGIACISGSPFRVLYEEILIRLRESGLIGKWTKDIIREVAGKSDGAEDEGLEPLSVETMQGAFIILAIGFMVAFFALIVEIFTYKCCL